MPGTHKQNRLMSMVAAYQSGHMPDASGKVREVAKHIKHSDALDFARGPHGSPKRRRSR
jgi:hypothetical protein